MTVEGNVGNEVALGLGKKMTRGKCLAGSPILG